MDLKSQNFQDYSIASGGITMISKEMESRIDRFISENRQNNVKDIATLVNIKSVSTKSDDPNAPFGEGCHKVLDKALSCARAWALQPKTMITMQALLFMATQKKKLQCWAIWTLFQRARAGAMTHMI